MTQKTQRHQSINSIGNNIFNAYTYQNSFSLGEHFHKSYELIYGIMGRARVTVDKRSYTLSSGDWLLIRPYEVHSFSVPDGTIIYIICFSLSYVKTFDRLLRTKKAESALFRCSDSVDRYFYENMFLKFPRFRKPSCETQTLLIKACLYAVCYEYLNNVPMHEYHPQKAEENVTIDILNYIDNHFRENISLQSIADQIGYSYRYVSRLFNWTFSINFRTLLNQYRYEYALQMLEDPNAKISDVAYESGFQSIRTMNRVFLQLGKVSPTEIMRANQKEQNVSLPDSFGSGI